MPALHRSQNRVVLELCHPDQLSDMNFQTHVCQIGKLAKQRQGEYEAKLMADHTAAAERYADLQAVLAARDQKLDELRAHVSSIRKDLADAVIRHEELEDELEAQQKKLEIAQNELSQKSEHQKAVARCLFI